MYHLQALLVLNLDIVHNDAVKEAQVYPSYRHLRVQFLANGIGDHSAQIALSNRQMDGYEQ